MIQLGVDVRLHHDGVLAHVALGHAETLGHGLGHATLGQRALTVSLTLLLTELTVPASHVPPPGPAQPSAGPRTVGAGRRGRALGRGSR